MSPILVRPVREQLEHDRIIRLLQTKYRRKFEVGINPGNEQTAPVGNGPAAWYPDVVLQSQERGRRLQAVIEVETAESVNHLEALAEWAHFAQIRAAFHLYVPASMVDVARRLCEDNQIQVHEIWSYLAFGDEVHFTNVHKSKEPVPVPRKAAKPAVSAKPAPAARPTPARNGSTPRRKAAAPAKRSSRAAAPPRKAAKKPARAQKRK